MYELFFSRHFHRLLLNLDLRSHRSLLVTTAWRSRGYVNLATTAARTHQPQPQPSGICLVLTISDHISTGASPRSALINLFDVDEQNSTNIFARNITCRGGTGIAFGSLGQYAELVSTCVPKSSRRTDAPSPHSQTTSRTSSSRTSR